MIRYQSAAALWGHEPTYRSEFWQTVGFLRMSDDPSGGAGGVSANAAITQATSFIIRDWVGKRLKIIGALPEKRWQISQLESNLLKGKRQNWR